MKTAKITESNTGKSSKRRFLICMNENKALKGEVESSEEQDLQRMPWVM